MQASDEILLAQFKQGDPRAFRDLVERYTAPLYNLALRLVRDPMEAENVTQETFLRVLLALDRVRLDAPLKPYLFQIAVNVCRDFARKRKPHLFSDLDQLNAPAAEPASEAIADDAPMLWEQLEETELRERVRAKFENLPAHYQVVITLRYVEDLSYEEIARALDLPLNTVRTHLRRAKAHLRAQLEKES
ncbi:MAG: sigma-70 family RNA polymerase sigma factor [Chloroflexi bacterium]|nr:sigma-70 family RNA polymerase sigma factor [Chloroflexota bacterium]